MKWLDAALAAVLLAGAARAGVADKCLEMRKHGREVEARECFSGLAGSANAEASAEGEWGLGRYEEANARFRQALKEHPESAQIRVRWGRLLLERFNRADAAQLFQEALEKDPKNAGAYVGMALVESAGFDAKAVEFAQKAAELDPKLVEARELLAYLHLEDGDEAEAGRAADEALKLDPDALEAMAVHAAMDWLKGSLLEEQPKSKWLDRMMVVNPGYGRAYSIPAHFFVINRRYVEGIRLYEMAIKIEPTLWEARSQLGIDLMRVGRSGEAKSQLALCYENGYRDSETVNSLRLLDSFKDYEHVRDGGANLMLAKKEADLLEPYFGEVANRAIAAYEEKYHYKISGLVSIEVYPNHEDFAVRTTGMPGLGALGVTFGTVVAMDSPSGRPPGEFHWGSTLWHEMSHVYVLTMTHHLVPRWFTEGLAMYEETQAAPGWGDRAQKDDIEAIQKGKLLPVADLDRGFVRPSYPQQVEVSYFQAGKICAYIAQKWGYAKLVSMIGDFGARKTTPEVIQGELGVAPAEFDKEFLAWLKQRYAAPLAHLDDWKKGAQRVAKLVAAHQYDEAIKEGLAIRDEFPQYVEAGSVYEMVATAQLAKGDKAGAITQLRRYADEGGRSPEVLKKLGALEQEAGQTDKAIAALERLNYIYPEDEELHRRLGDLYLDKREAAKAIREYRALLALNPLDQAASHYGLARAYHEANQLKEAREQVLMALEAAPEYRPAQKLLLELTK
jgi:tetratricopeptide (TPR) repeat protein